MKIVRAMIGALFLALIQILVGGLGEGLFTGVAYFVGRPFIWLLSFGHYRALQFGEDESKLTPFSQSMFEDANGAIVFSIELTAMIGVTLAAFAAAAWFFGWFAFG